MKRQKSLKSFFRKSSKEDEGAVPVSHEEASTATTFSSPEADSADPAPPAAPPNTPAVANVRTIFDPLDLGLFLSQVPSIDEELKFKLATKPWTPDNKFDFPAQVIGGAKKRSFQLSWLKRYPWLAYSQAAGGALCRPCVLFTTQGGAGKGSHTELGQLVSASYSRWKNALEDFNKHSVRDYHKRAVQACDDFIAVKSGAKVNVFQAVQRQSDQEKKVEMHVLCAVVEAIIFCGRQEIALRGDVDAGRIRVEQPTFNDGNFRALLRFRIHAGDELLGNYMKNASPTALYTSPQIQNEFIGIISDYLIEKVMERIKLAKYFTILADETTDRKNVCQMAICARYVDVSLPIKILREDFLGFSPVTDATGKGLADNIVTEGTGKGLNFVNCRDQGYDGAGAMKGRFKGVQAIIKRSYPKAVYTHCSSHCLNLSLNDAASLTEVKQAIGVIKETCNFFSRSSFRANVLKKEFALHPEIAACELVKVCETRWVERHRAVIIFLQAILIVVSSLELLEEGDDEPDSQEKEKNPSSLHRAICNFPFLVTVVVMERCMSVTYSLSKYLQTVNIDLFAAMEQVQGCMDTLNEMRADDSIFAGLFKKAVDIANQLGVEPSKPRTVGTQRYRSNQPSGNEEEFYRRSVYFPYIDYLVSSLRERFIEHRKEIEALACVIPAETKKRSFAALKPALEFYAEDLHSQHAAEIEAEWDVWRNKWMNENDAPRNAVDGLNACNEHLFPNIYILLLLLCTLAVTSASVERSFSVLKRLLTWLRNRTGEERLSGLAIIALYRDIPIPEKEIVKRFLAKKNRRINL